MKFKKLLLLLPIILLVSACGKSETFDMDSILENKGPIIQLSIHEDGKPINMNQQAITDRVKLDKFHSIVNEMEIKEIEIDEYREVIEKIYQEDKINSLSVSVVTENVSADETNMNGLTYNFLKDGTVIIANIENNKGETFYEIIEKESSLYKELNTFYKENVEIKVIENVLEQLEKQENEN